jgi:hypothetical protein
MRNSPVKNEDVYANPYESLLTSMNKIRISNRTSPSATNTSRKRRQNPSVTAARLTDLAKNIEHHTTYNPLKSDYVPYQSALTRSKRYKTSNSVPKVQVPVRLSHIGRSTGITLHKRIKYRKKSKKSDCSSQSDFGSYTQRRR